MTYRALNGLFGLFVGCFSIALIVSLFRDDFLRRFHWGKGGRTPISRLSILVFLPFSLFWLVLTAGVLVAFGWLPKA